MDNLIRNILPKYKQDHLNPDDETYTADIKHILAAYDTDPESRKERRCAALCGTRYG
ncbi:MAG: hypothetical protein GDA36_14210 [Rhodobacteraceae bacterium]|nr:hypothetical protein [Paracoccaceae bacterium]